MGFPSFQALMWLPYASTGEGVITVSRIEPNIVFSLYKWLQEVQYQVGLVTGGLQDHYQGLRIRAGFPDDLTAIDTPTLAVSGLDTQCGELFYGEDTIESVYPCAIYGFVVRQADDATHRVYRDRLSSTVYQLLRRVADGEGIPLYDHVTRLEIEDGRLEVLRPRKRIIPSVDIEMPAMRYRFVVELEIPYVD